MKTLVGLMSVAMAVITTTAEAGVTSCESAEVVNGNFVVSATLELDDAKGSYLFYENFSPLVPQWPPAGKYITGTFSKNAQTLVFTAKDQPLGELRNSTFASGYYGKIEGYSFIGCTF